MTAHDVPSSKTVHHLLTIAIFVHVQCVDGQRPRPPVDPYIVSGGHVRVAVVFQLESLGRSHVQAAFAGGVGGGVSSDPAPVCAPFEGWVCGVGGLG